MTQGKQATIDESDLAIIAPYQWYARQGNNGIWYAETHGKDAEGKYTVLRMHRLILDAPKGVRVDHRNHLTFPFKNPEIPYVF